MGSGNRGGGEAQAGICTQVYWTAPSEKIPWSPFVLLKRVEVTSSYVKADVPSLSLGRYNPGSSPRPIKTRPLHFAR